jgi:acyl carrier protein
MPVAEQVKSLIVKHLGLDAHKLAPEALFRDGLGADSLDAFELLMAFEDEFDIVIPDEDAGTMQCVQDAIRYIEARVTAGTDGVQSPPLGSVGTAT